MHTSLVLSGVDRTGSKDLTGTSNRKQAIGNQAIGNKQSEQAIRNHSRDSLNQGLMNTIGKSSFENFWLFAGTFYKNPSVKLISLILIRVLLQRFRNHL